MDSAPRLELECKYIKDLYLIVRVKNWRANDLAEHLSLQALAKLFPCGERQVSTSQPQSSMQHFEASLDEVMIFTFWSRVRQRLLSLLGFQCCRSFALP